MKRRFLAVGERLLKILLLVTLFAILTTMACTYTEQTPGMYCDSQTVCPESKPGRYWYCNIALNSCVVSATQFDLGIGGGDDAGLDAGSGLE